MRTRADIECWLTDMDGVLVHENTPDPGRLRAAAAVARPGNAVPGAHEQLDLHAPRSERPAAGIRSRRARGVHLDLRARDRRLPAQPGARCERVRDRRGGPDHRAARGRVHHDRDRSRLRRGRRDAQLLVRGDHEGDPLHRRRRALHRDQSRRDRSVGRRRPAGHGRDHARSSRRRSARSRTSSASRTR